jgi:Protein of unknown function (DUF2587)
MTEQAQPPTDDTTSDTSQRDSGSDPAIASTGDTTTTPGGSVESGAQLVTESTNDGESLEEVTTMVQQPAKVMRIGTMIKQLLEEVRAAPLDESGRARLRAIHESSIAELEQGLSPDLQAELHRLSLPFGDGVPSEAELRIAQAQLVGWLEGLFHGIQAAFAQQLAMRQGELDRRALPGGAGGSGGPGGAGRVVIGPNGQIIALPEGAGGAGGVGENDPRGTGQYL